MSREVRRVPANWQHPKNARGYYEPLLDHYRTAVSDWDEANTNWKPCTTTCCCANHEDCKGPRPVQEDYMPDWSDMERTHWMMYESTSEGTPISPAFATPQELCRWLVDNNASAFADQTASYDAWWAVCQEGSSAGSAALTTDGEWISGAEALLR